MATMKERTDGSSVRMRDDINIARSITPPTSSFNIARDIVSVTEEEVYLVHYLRHCAEEGWSGSFFS